VAFREKGFYSPYTQRQPAVILPEDARDCLALGDFADRTKLPPTVGTHTDVAIILGNAITKASGISYWSHLKVVAFSTEPARRRARLGGMLNFYHREAA
jgi:hypothetical protein